MFPGIELDVSLACRAFLDRIGEGGRRERLEYLMCLMPWSGVSLGVKRCSYEDKRACSELLILPFFLCRSEVGKAGGCWSPGRKTVMIAVELQIARPWDVDAKESTPGLLGHEKE